MANEDGYGEGFDAVRELIRQMEASYDELQADRDALNRRLIIAEAHCERAAESLPWLKEQLAKERTGE